MNDWYSLNDFEITFFKGVTPKYVDESDIIVINQRCIRNNKIDYTFARFHDNSKKIPKNKELKIGDLLFNSTGQGTAGRCAMVKSLPKNKTVITDSHVLAVRLKDYYTANCLSYSFFKEESYLQSLIDGSTGQGELDRIRLFNVYFRLPQANFRKDVCAILNTLNIKINLNNKINAILKAKAKLLYDYWFVQFEFPTPAGSSSGIEGKPYKSSGGKMVYHKKLKREIPEGWEVKRLVEIAEIERGKLLTAKSADLCGEIKVVSAGLDFSYYHSDWNRRKNTITVSGSGANAGFVNFWREPIYANDCTTVRGKTDSVTFILHQFLKIRQDYIYKQARGSAQPHVYPKDLEVLKIEIPNFDLTEKYGKEISSLNDRITNNIKQNQHLSSLRDWLLPMLMNGQVGVERAYEVVDGELGMVAEPGEGYEGNRK